MIAWPSSFTSQAGKEGDQSLDLGCAQGVPIARHHGDPELLFEFTQVSLAERMESVGRIAQLNRELVFADSDTCDSVAIASNSTDYEKRFRRGSAGVQ